MAKAAPAEQLKLLELQGGLDAKLRSLAGRRKVLETDPRITDLTDALNVANGELGAAKVAVHDAEAELRRAEADVEQVATRIERDETRLNSGTGLSKDLVALQSDIASLNKRRSDLEDVELEILERWIRCGSVRLPSRRSWTTSRARSAASGLSWTRLLQRLPLKKPWSAGNVPLSRNHWTRECLPSTRRPLPSGESVQPGCSTVSPKAPA